VNSIKCIGVFVVTNRKDKKEIEWWNKNGGISSLLLANPKFEEVFKQLEDKNIAYKCEVLVTQREISSGIKTDGLVEKALKTVSYGDQDSVVL
jgi:hypothetical protein